MVTVEQAAERVEAFVQGCAEGDLGRVRVVLSRTQDRGAYWVFFYDSAKYLDSGDRRDALIGNAPVIYEKLSGRMLATGTAEPLSYYLRLFERTGAVR